VGHRERGGAELIVQIETGDRRLLAGIDRALEEAALRSGEWLACRPGCTQCCMGPFAITQLDAIRLRRGLEKLEGTDPERAARVRKRAGEHAAAIGPEYPGDAETGELRDEYALPESMDDVACPVLDPDTGWCDLYEARPVTCRSFGPATRLGEEEFGACELCYVGATAEEIAGCAVDMDAEGLEAELLGTLDESGRRGLTIVAFAVR